MAQIDTATMLGEVGTSNSSDGVAAKFRHRSEIATSTRASEG